MATKNYLEGIVKISKANYDILKAGGTVDGYKYDPKTVYMVQYDDDTIVYTNNNQTISGNKTFTGDTVIYDLTVNDGITISDPDKRSDKLFFATDGSIQEIEIESVTFEEAEEEGKEGVADALSYHDVIIENERITAEAFEAVAGTVGLEEDFSVDWEGHFDEGTTIVEAIKKTSEADVNHLKETTYAELVGLRDNGELVPGMQYRITDYQCTTTTTDTQSANHLFDIIVVADSETVLNETARAINHVPAEGETDYFANSTLQSWELKYSLDNDTARFDWADTVNGKGVVYYMKDEYNNEVPYDFKNIQFKRKLTNGSLDNTNGTDTFVYTFNAYEQNTGVHYDAVMVTGQASKLDNGCNNASGNVIKPFTSAWTSGATDTKARLNNIVFLNLFKAGTSTFFDCHFNTFEGNCYNNTFGNDCQFNTFGGNCHDNTFGNGADRNTFKSDATNNVFGYDCGVNVFGPYCQNNIAGDVFWGNIMNNRCQNNTFGDEFLYNSAGGYFRENHFGNICQENSFGNGCTNITFGSNCWDNSFGNNNSDITFGTECQANTVENECDTITIGNYSYYNSFGNETRIISFGDGFSENIVEHGARCLSGGNWCSENVFGAECFYIVFGSADGVKDQYYKNTIGKADYSLYLDSTVTRGNYDGICLVTIGPGIHGKWNPKTTSDYRLIEHNVFDQNYETFYRLNNSETILLDE